MAPMILAGGGLAALMAAGSFSVQGPFQLLLNNNQKTVGATEMDY